MPLRKGWGLCSPRSKSDGCYHPVTFGSCSLTPSEKNYHSSKLEFLALKWSIMEHFKEYLVYSPFVVRTDNNPLTYILMTPNLDATGHQWVGALASFQFKLEYQKGADNSATDVLSRVPISHSRETIQVIIGANIWAANQAEVRAREELLEEHECLSQEVRVQAAKLAPMCIIDWKEAQEADTALAACCKWLCLRKDMPLSRRDAFPKECLGVEVGTEQGKMFFHIHNSLVLNKGLMYVSTTPKGETEGVLTFVVPVGQCRMALNGVHHNASHQGQQRTLALAQERFWWPMMAEDCHAIVRGCPHCRAFEGVVPKAPLCPIRAYAPSELVHLDYTSIESTMELNKPPVVKNVLVCDKKAQWEQHLLELLQAYNSTWSVVTGYSPHYLMFRRHPHLPVDYYFPTVSAF